MSDEDEDFDLLGHAPTSDGKPRPNRPKSPPVTDVDDVASDQLRSFVERIENLEQEKKAIADDIKDVYAEAKGNGFDTKVLRKVVAMRKQDAQERQEQEAILDLYLQALGMAAGG